MAKDFNIKCFELIPLLKDLKIIEKISAQITCIDVNNQDVYLGTIDSFILFYSNLLRSSSESSNINNLKPTSFKYLPQKKPIIKLKVLSIFDRIICHCDNILQLNYTNNLEIVQNFNRLRNVFEFCLNENPITLDPFQIELCIAKRKLIQICLLNSDDKLSILKDINLNEQPISMSMNNYYICMVSMNNYFMINWDTCNIQLLCDNPNNNDFTGEKTSLPICKYIQRDEFLIDGPSNLGVFVKTTGISERPPIDWGMNVLKIAYSYPYIICLKSHSISIISMIDQKIKDEFLFENGIHIDNFDGNIVVTTKNSLFTLKRISWQKQFDSLLSNEKSQEAIDLFQNLYETGMMTDEEYNQFDVIKIRAGLIELKNRNYQQAKHYLISGQCEIELVLRLNKDLLEKLKIFPFANPYNEHDGNNEKMQALIAKIIETLDRNEINNFLIDYIDHLINYIDYDTEHVDYKLIKTAKLFLYFENIDDTNRESIRKFFKNEKKTDNYYHELIEKFLKEKNYHYFLSLYYASRNNYEKSIELLKKLEIKSIYDKYYPGIEELKSILNECKNTQLIMNNIEFLIEYDEKNETDHALQILIHNTMIENDKFILINPEFIIHNLNKHRNILILYLEYLIYQMNLKQSKIHTTLLIIYIEILSIYHENEEQDAKIYQNIKQKLQKLLFKSNSYDEKIILKYLIKNNFHHEQAILYGKLGEHRKSFEIYLNEQRNDFKNALKHCIYYGNNNDNYQGINKSNNECNNIYQILLSIYLDLYRKNGPEILKPFIEYLNHHKCRFDLMNTLKQLPGDWQINLIEKHLTNQLNEMFHIKFQSSFGRIMALSLVEKKRANKQRLINQSIRIDRNSTCFLCQTKLLDSKFVWLPSSKQIIHDFCYYSQQLQNNNNINDGDIVKN